MHQDPKLEQDRAELMERLARFLIRQDPDSESAQKARELRRALADDCDACDSEAA